MKLRLTKRYNAATHTYMHKLLGSFVILLLSLGNSYAQVRVPFAPRTALETPTQSIYSVQGDFAMIGNTNLTLVNYGNLTNNNNDMEYVDADNDASTLNSSTATLTFSTENDAIPECSKILYAGLYWTGRAASVREVDTRTFTVTKNGVTKTFDKQRVLIQGPEATSYQEINANGIIAFPTDGDDFNIYSAYADITEYVRTNGLGAYTVADIATREGNADNVGYFGGWGMVVVYENPKMRFRDITVFDGHAFVADGPGTFDVPISGFKSLENGDVNLKLGVMAAEGDVSVSGDFLQMLRQDTNTFEALSHSGNSADNFFNSSVITDGPRTFSDRPNSTGVDIAVFDIDNGNDNTDPSDDNKFIDNLQSSTTIRYGSTRDSYVIFNITFAVEAFVPEPEVIVSNTSINGNPPSDTNTTLAPNESANFVIDIRNTGTEELNDTRITIPVPDAVDITNFNISTETFPPFSTTNIPVFDPSIGANGAIVWDLGTLPLSTNTNDILAQLSLSLTVTTDCTILQDPDFVPQVALSGTVSGTGSVSLVEFNKDLIKGFETDGICEGNPIPAPLLIPVNFREFVDTPPTASNPDPITVQCTADIPEADVTVVTDEADNSGIAPIVAFVSDVSNNQSNPETITRTYSVTDDCGNTINVTQTITVNDTEDPTITCPANISISTSNDSTGNCATTVDLGTPTTDDNCEIAEVIAQVDGITIDPETFIFELEETQITWIATDTSGNTASCEQTVTITDDENPIALCQNVEIALDASGTATLTAEAIDNNSTDNCGIATREASQTSFTCADIGDNTVTLTVTDNAGNTTTCEATVTVINLINPTIECPANVEAATSNDGTGNCTTTVAIGTPTATNNCDINTVIARVDNTPIDPTTFEFELGTTTVIWTVTNSSGNTSSCEQTVTVTDNEAPVANCQNITVALDENTNTATITPEQINNNSTDNCDAITSISLSETTFTCDNVGENTVVLTVTDENGNEGTCNAIITVEDTINPIALCQNVEIALDATGTATLTAEDIDNNSTDNCGIATREASQTSFTCADIGDNTVTLTVTDNAGNRATCEATVTVVNTISPTITCPDPIRTTTSANGVGNCSTTINLGVPTATNNCAINTVTAAVNDTVIDPSTFEFQLGTTTVTWTVTDSSGNTSTCEQSVTVTDDEAPVANCQNITVALDENTNTATITPEQINNNSTDNCDAITSISLSETTFTCDNVGENTVVLTVTDENGNEGTCNAIITVEDTITPIALCQNVEIALDATGTATLTAEAIDDNSTDNCGIASREISQTTFTCDNIGANTVRLTITDNSGNTAFCDATVIVVNNSIPTLTCSGPIATTTSADSLGNCTTTVNLVPPTVTNNCSISTITATVNEVEINPATFEFPLGTTTVIWTAIDNSGNFNSCNQMVTVTDDERPIITDCPAPVEVNADLGLCTASNVNLGMPIATDNCGLALDGISNNASEPFALGETVITWSVVDASGNIATCEQTIIVRDAETPEVTCPEALSVFVDQDSCEATNVNLGDLDIQDCSSVEVSNDAPTAFPLGETVVTWLVVDNAGNTTECTQSVIVVDNQPPTFTTLVANITVECDNIPPVVTLSATDNCGEVAITFEQNRIDGDCISNYVLERTWTATDGVGLETAFTQIITVQDTTAPEFIGNLPSEITVECDAIPEPETLEAEDNCSAVTITVNDETTAGACSGTFTLTRTWTATDACGLSTDFSQTINVIDTTAPVPLDPIAPNITVSCTDIPDVPNIEFADNCSSDIITVFNEVNGFDDTVFEDYQITRTWTVRDACANEAVYTQTLNVVLDEIVTTVNAPDACYNDGVIDLNDYLSTDTVTGTWELIEGNTLAQLNANIFDPTTLILTDDFKPGSAPINYLLRYTGLQDGCIDITEVSIAINAECIVLPCGVNDVTVTKALTPNNDGINDRFDIKGIELCGFVASVKIFNRWGALIFQSNDYGLGEGQGSWQGEAHNAALGASGTVPNGTYYYIINLENSGLPPFTGPIYIGTK